MDASYKKYEVIRNKRKYTDYKVCKEGKIPPTSICDWKSGRSKPKIDKLWSISQVLDCSIEDLLDEE